MILRDSIRKAVKVICADMKGFVIPHEQEERLRGVLRLDEVEEKGFEVRDALRRLRDLVERPDDEQDLTQEEMVQAVQQLAQLAVLAANFQILVDSGSRQFASQNKLLEARIQPVHERRNQLRKLWEGGNFSSRDRCAEEEWEALGFPSARAARESLNGTADPTKTL